jgi:glycosyltransferase involved in cell wall biosynthesis
LCGEDRQGYQQNLRGEIDEAERAFVIFTGFVSDQELRILYCSCRAFLYLSEYEGFGLPVLEAMACGAPVIAADRTSLPEVVGNAGFLVDPDDTVAVAGVMRKLVMDEQLWRACADRSIMRAGAFSWQKCADTVVSRMYRDRLASSA